MEVFRCCLCGECFEGFGNNPDPLALDDDERCCDMCDSMFVIPARLFQLQAGRRLRESEVKALRLNIKEELGR